MHLIKTLIYHDLLHLIKLLKLNTAAILDLAAALVHNSTQKNNFAPSDVHVLVQIENTTRCISRRVWQISWDRSLVIDSLV